MTTSWPRIFLIYGIGITGAGQLGIVPPLVPTLQSALDLSLAASGMTVSIVTLVSAVFGLLAGGWSARLGHVRALQIGVLIMAAAAVLCATAGDGTTLLAARGLAGFGYLLVVVAAPSLMAEAVEPRHHPVALSLWSTFVPAGIALSGLAAASLAARADWRTVFGADAGLLALAAAGAGIFLRQNHAPRTSGRQIWLVGSLHATIPLAVAFFCFALLFLALAGLLPAYLVENRGMLPTSAGRVVAIATAFGIVGSFLGGWLMRRGAKPNRLVAAGLAASTTIAALTFLSAAPVSIALAGFALSFTLGGLVPAAVFASVPAAVFASVPSIAAGARAIGPINGLMAQAGSLGTLVGPPLLALWVEQAGWPLAPMLLLAVATVGATSALVRLRRP
jgi:MFS family permease